MRYNNFVKTLLLWYAKNPLSYLSRLGAPRLLVFIFVWQDQVQDDSCHG